MRSTKYPETPYFVPNGADREETAVLLVGTAREFGLSQRSIRVTVGGFKISEELADLIYEDNAGDGAADDTFVVADYSVADVKEFVTSNPDEAEAVLAAEVEGKNRKSLVEWLGEFNNTETSGDRAEKNSDTATATDKE